MPGKTLMKRYDEAFVEKRRAELETYLQVRLPDTAAASTQKQLHSGRQQQTKRALQHAEQQHKRALHSSLPTDKFHPFLPVPFCSVPLTKPTAQSASTPTVVPVAVGAPAGLRAPALPLQINTLCAHRSNTVGPDPNPGGRLEPWLSLPKKNKSKYQPGCVV